MNTDTTSTNMEKMIDVFISLFTTEQDLDTLAERMAVKRKELFEDKLQGTLTDANNGIICVDALVHPQKEASDRNTKYTEKKFELTFNVCNMIIKIVLLYNFYTVSERYGTTNIYLFKPQGVKSVENSYGSWFFHHSGISEHLMEEVNETFGTDAIKVMKCLNVVMHNAETFDY